MIYKMTMRHHLQRSSSCLFKKMISVLPFFVILLLLMIKSCISTSSSTVMSGDAADSSYSSITEFHHLLRRGKFNAEHHSNIIDEQEIDDHLYYLQEDEKQQQHRSIKADITSTSTILLTQSSTFQIVMSTILSVLIILQLLLLLSLLHNRSKRVLEFAQPIVICIFLASSIITTVACYFYIYITDSPSATICAIREPLVFLSVSWMGATVGGRAWRISSLLNNPLLTVGNNGDGSSSSVPRVEQVRQWTLRVISVLSGCEYSAVKLAVSSRISKNSRSGASGRPLRVKITSFQMMRATLFMVLPQLLWQIVVLSTPVLRSSRELLSYSHSYNDDEVVMMEQYQCQSSVGFWPNYVSIALTLFPYAIAYLLNVRPKSELDLLPEIVDEREHLKQSFFIFARVLVVAVPMIGLTYKNNPEAKAYGAICSILGLPLACCYYIAYVKLRSIQSNTAISKQQLRGSVSSATTGISGGDDAEGRSSAAVAVRMAEMYSRIGRVEETVQLVDETLSVFRKGNSGSLGLQNEGRQEVASGFTTNDLKALEEDELQLIIQLLRLKGNALIKLEGPAGFAMSAKLNIDALKIFENCPAADKMKDISFMFPIYNIVGIQMKGGVIDQDDECSLEMELAIRFCREAQLQAYHYARSLANLAEMYGRVGKPDDAFIYFDRMKAVYMKQDHPKLLLDAYAVDRCAVSFATSALWYLQKGQIDDAIERCDYVIDHVLPHYESKDIIGLYHIFVQIIRVLKWNGQVNKAREAYSTFMPDAANNHFAVGSIHKPMVLLLQICEGSSHEYEMDKMPQDIDLVLSFDAADMTDNNFTCDGWSMKSMAAELCMLLARRLDAGDTARERLIDRGLMMATVAQQRVKASNGMVKHILAYEANKDIHNELLRLAKEEVNVDRNVIYGKISNSAMPSLSQHRQASMTMRLDVKSSVKGKTKTTLKSNSSALKSSLKGTATLASADKFSVRNETYNTNGSATTNSNGSAAKKSATRKSPPSPKPSQIEISTRKKFMITQFSSIGSNGSAKNRSSHHSCESIQESTNNSNESSQFDCASEENVKDVANVV